ncbi:Plastidic glucose transporter 4 [Linum perenne]
MESKSAKDFPIKSILKQSPSPSPLHPNSGDGEENRNQNQNRLMKQQKFVRSRLRVSINLPDNEISLRQQSFREGDGNCAAAAAGAAAKRFVFSEMGKRRTVLEVLRELDADILALQEVKAEEEKEMKPLTIMPVSSTFAVKATSGNVFGFDAGLQDLRRIKQRRVGLACVSADRRRVRLTNSASLDRNFCMRSGMITSCFGQRTDSPSMGTEMVQPSFFRSRPVRALSSDDDIEDAAPLNPQDLTVQKGSSTGTVLPFVGVACLGATLFGYHLGTCLQNYDCVVLFPCLSITAPLCCFRVVNGALEYLAKDLGIAENAVVQGWIVSTLLAGATVGTFTGGALADKFGRTRTFQLDAIPLTIGAILCATAQTVQTMIIGRLLAGIGIGISSAIVPLYISEISPTEIRGALGSVNQLFICIGILLALVAGLPLAGNPIWWRTMFSISAVPSILLALGMAFSPESPRWLVQQGKIPEAQKSIQTLYGKERVSEVMQDLSASGQGSSEAEAGWFDLFSKRYWKVVSVGVALFFFQQMAGINAVVYYSTAVFRSVGIGSDVAASALVGASNAASMLLLSLSLTWKVLAPYSGTLAVLGTVCYVLSFSLGAGPVPALLLPEIFANRIRAKAVSLSLGMHWIANFVIGLYFLSVVNKYGISMVYLGFSGICLLAVVYVLNNVVETKGRSLEEIERALTTTA